MREPLLAAALALAACASSQGAAPPAPPPPADHKALASPACQAKKPTECGAAAPSYSREVAPIVAKRCLSCHAQGGEAAEDHDFSRFAALHAQRNAVAANVGSCTMPPSSAPALTADEAATLLRWVACGAPEN